MNDHVCELIDRLYGGNVLTADEYAEVVGGMCKETAEYAASKAVIKRKEIYGNSVYIRGLIEISSYCRNDCYYCGIRRSNACAERFRLTRDEILACADEGYRLGFRTIVMQGGEDMYFTDEVVCGIVSSIKERYPDVAVTLSLGERSDESYRLLREAGADRYLLRHETADADHYARLHPAEMSYENRMRCLNVLRDLGYQTGCGFMVGSPYQTVETIAKDLKFIETFRPEMCGIGPFIPHHDTPLAGHRAGSVDLTLYLLSIIRLIHPTVLLPATTALATLTGDGRERGILAGANVIMPNLSPPEVRSKYELYDNKVYSGEESAQNLIRLARSMQSIGYNIVTDRGDHRNR